MCDINGDKPEIYICTSNRNAGKTTYFNKYMVNSWLKTNGKFCLIYRFNYELDSVADKFFKDIQTLFFPNYTMTSKSRNKGLFHELFINDQSCGYAVTLNSADQIKKISHLFSDVTKMLFDEFQSETNHYCPEEIKKLISVHTSLARGHGEQVKYLPLYMVGNPVSLINPYYISLNISSRLTNDVKFLRGNGFVLEQGFVESASIMQQKSAFNRAFENETYIAYAAQNVYLNDNNSFIEQPQGASKYYCTLRYNKVDYGIREYAQKGIVYCNKNADNTFPIRICVTTDDHNTNYVMLRKNSYIIDTLRFYFEQGCFRFKDIQCKEALLASISY